MPGRSALTVTPCTATAVPIASSVDGHCSRRDTVVVTASGGGWKEEACAIAVWTCLNFTIPIKAMNAAITVTIQIIRLVMGSLPFEKTPG